MLVCYIWHRLAGSYRDGEIGVSDEHLALIPGLVLGILILNKLFPGIGHHLKDSCLDKQDEFAETDNSMFPLAMLSINVNFVKPHIHAESHQLRSQII